MSPSKVNKQAARQGRRCVHQAVPGLGNGAADTEVRGVGVGVGDVGVNILVWLSVGSVNEHLRESS